MKTNEKWQEIEKQIHTLQSNPNHIFHGTVMDYWLNHATYHCKCSYFGRPTEEEEDVDETTLDQTRWDQILLKDFDFNEWIEICFQEFFPYAMDYFDEIKSNKKEILDQIDSLMEYPYFEFDLSDENEDWNNDDLNWKADICRENYCEKNNLASWDEYISQEQEDHTDPDPNNFKNNQWKEIVKDIFEKEIYLLNH